MGANRTKFGLMVAGRTLFGIGCESMYVGQSALVAEWFINYELPLAMSMVSFVPLFGSFAGGALTPHIYNKNIAGGKSFKRAFGLGFVLCLFCFLIVLILNWLDRKTEKADKVWLQKYTSEKKMQDNGTRDET